MVQAPSCVAGVRRCAACYTVEVRGDVEHADFMDEGAGRKRLGEIQCRQGECGPP